MRRARLAGEACGKTECWYVARAMAGAQVGLGLRPGINREMFRLAIEANQAEHMLNWLDVQRRRNDLRGCRHGSCRRPRLHHR